MPPPTKKIKSEATKEIVPDANIIVQFKSSSGEGTGPQIELPHRASPQQLELLLNKLIKADRAEKRKRGDDDEDDENDKDEQTPFAFFIGDQELMGEIGDFVREKGLSAESALEVVFQPRAAFRVRPVARCSATMEGHSESVLAVAFSPDGRRLASGSGDTTLRFWDMGTQGPQTECRGHGNWVLAVSWSPDAKYVATGDMDGVIRLWDPETGKDLGRCSGHRAWITSLSWEPAHRCYPSLHFASGSKDNTIRIWDAVTKQCLRTFSNHRMMITQVRWGGEGLLYSASRDCSLSVWDADEGKLVRTLAGHGHWINTLALSSDYALRTGAFDHSASTPATVEEGKAKALERYQEATNNLPERLVSGSDDFTLCLYEPSKGKQPINRMTGHVQLVNQVSFSPNGRIIASASFDKSVKLWCGLKGNFLATLRAHVGPVYQVAWSADSRMVVSASKDSTLKVWDARTFKVRVELPGHADEVFCVDWSPGLGVSVASGGKDRCLKLWRQ
mmetsp:Transcript_28842/g.52976  ORF Transcript_28842/g.52976 Transcript_28842/m.52976 type:complete len:504 (-) Transcript_28842:23-1534(-)